MDAVIARNVRVFREAKNWSQQHLAETAGIALRTVQRVECAQGASRETLAALSNALDAPVELLQTDIEEWSENMRRQQEALLKTRDLIPVHPVTGPEQLLNAVVGADASLLQCHSSQGEARDAFALLATSIRA
jgi:transcriptional regulator with XRE-family HTH domain